MPGLRRAKSRSSVTRSPGSRVSSQLARSCAFSDACRARSVDHAALTARCRLRHRAQLVGEAAKAAGGLVLLHAGLLAHLVLRLVGQVARLALGLGGDVPGLVARRRRDVAGLVLRGLRGRTRACVRPGSRARDARIGLGECPRRRLVATVCTGRHQRSPLDGCPRRGRLSGVDVAEAAGPKPPERKGCRGVLVTPRRRPTRGRQVVWDLYHGQRSPNARAPFVIDLVRRDSVPGPGRPAQAGRPDRPAPDVVEGRAEADVHRVQGRQLHRLGGGPHVLRRAGGLPRDDRAAVDHRPRRRPEEDDRPAAADRRHPRAVVGRRDVRRTHRADRRPTLGGRASPWSSGC